jgi:hypothetical protein
MRIIKLASLFLVTLLGCSPDSPDITFDGSAPPGGDGGAGDGGGPGGESSGGSTGNASGGSSGSGNSGSGNTGGPFKECAATRTEAERQLRPVDIVWVIDASGSMNDEAEVVQTNMNAFVQAIEASGIEDYRVVVVTDEGFVEVPAPLGVDSERFLFVPHNVGSSDSQAVLLSEFTSYSAFLRPQAITHFVIVTDDDENPLTASSFVTSMQNNLGHEFKVHAIASEGRQSCGLFGCREVACKNATNRAAAVGSEHYAAATMTGGLTFSICTEDWSALFTELAAAVSVSSPIPCELLVPEAPAGKKLNPEKVNVVFSEPDQDPADGQAFPRVEGQSACADAAAWYYDDKKEPSRILLCPGACTEVEAGGTLDIALGCATIIQ